MALASEIMGGGISGGTARAIGGQYATIAAAGSVLGDATAIGASMVMVTAADGTKGVRLPSAQVGDEVWVFNNAGSTLKVWPQSASVGISVAGTGVGTVANHFPQLTYKATVYKLITPIQWLAITSA